MRNRKSASSLRIRSNARSLVKWALAPVSLLLIAPLLAGAAEAGISPELPEDVVFSDKDLPQIEARKFEVRVAKTSRSRTVYLLDDDASARPSPGKIILLKRENEPVMAFRVLKVYDERRQLAARKIRVYGGTVHLESGDSFSAIEKLADLVAVPPTPETIEEDKRELEEFEDELEADTGEVWSDPAPPPRTPSSKKKKVNPDDVPPAELAALEYDPELDSESSPPPGAGADEEFDEELLGDEGSSYGIATEDAALIEPNRHLVSAGAGWSLNKLRSDSVYEVGGVRYSYAMRRIVLIRSSRLQDALSAEIGMFVYKPIYNEGSYTVTPFTGSVRYDIQSARGFTLYFYLGMTLNTVLPAKNADLNKAADLARPMPAGGMGFLFPFGPNWNVRANLGIDSMDVGLALRF